jgi:aminotransferase in exopolysaccharide biosynthesis
MYGSVVDVIREMYSQPKDFIPLHAPVFEGNEKRYLEECIDSTFVSSVGKFVDRFEELVEDFTGAKKAVVCVNGTNALHLALQLVGVQREDEIVTQSLTFIATANAISYAGAHPVFLDVDKDTMGLSPKAVEKWLSENAEIKNNVCYNRSTGRRIKACVPMHTFGHPVKLTELIAVCEKFHLELVEDAAESLGSFYQGKHTGTFGKIGVLSFNGNKTITTGGGGMLLFNDEKLAEHAKHLTTQAKLPHKWEFAHDHIGYNYRMPNLNAAVGCAQIEKIEDVLKSKRKIAEKYTEFFANSSIKFFVEPNDCKSNYWLNTVLLPSQEERDQFLAFTNERGVMTRPIWKLMNRLPMFKDCQKDELTNSIWFEERVVNIPSSIISWT